MKFISLTSFDGSSRNSSATWSVSSMSLLLLFSTMLFSSFSFAELKQPDINEVKRAVDDVDTANFIIKYANRVRISRGNLVNLDLSRNDLSTLPNGFASLTELKNLNLSNNNFNHFPYSVLQLGKLEMLSVIGNDMVAIPDDIDLLRNMKSLTLGANEIKTVPDSICKLTKLESLKLSDNKIRKLPDCIGDLTQLEVISIYDNELTSIPDSITNLTELFMLSLKGNKLTTLPDNMGQLVKMRHMNIENNMIKTLPASLSRMDKLESIGTTFGSDKKFERRRGESPKSFFERCYKFRWRKDATYTAKEENAPAEKEVREKPTIRKESLEREIGKEIGRAIVDKILGGKDEKEQSSAGVTQTPTVVTPVEQVPLTLSSKHIVVEGNPAKAQAPIAIDFKDMPGNQGDWISLVKVTSPDDTYGDYFYPYGKTVGKHSFSGVAPGEYEIRVYYDWPAGGYNVQDRFRLLVQ